MTAIHIVNTFTYPLGKEDVVKKAKELAHRNGVSFSAYVVELLEQEVQKKVEAQTDPLNLSKVLVSDDSPLAKINNPNTLDAFMPYDKLRDRVSEIDDTHTLSTLIRNGHVIETVARTKLINIKKNQ